MILRTRLKLSKHQANLFYLIIVYMLYKLRINDLFNSYHSHRSIYDIYKLDCKNSLTVKNIKKDIFIKHFFITIDKFKIFDIHIKTTLLNSYFDKLLRKILIINQILFQIISIIIELFYSNELRKRALNKISNHYNNKTLLNYLYTWLKA